jgi:ribosome maturation factor RimP
MRRVYTSGDYVVGGCPTFFGGFEEWAAGPLFFGRTMALDKQNIEQKVRELCSPLLVAEGLELIDVEYVREREGFILRMFIDKPGGGVGLEDCTKASQAVDTVLDVEDFIPNEYNLEVSSPGLNRPLTRAEHFVKAVGKKVKLKTFGPLFEPPRKNFTGLLKAADAEKVIVEVDGAGSFTVPIKDIAKANLEFEF